MNRRRWSLRLRLTLLTSGLLALALVAGAIALTTVLSTSRVAALDTVLRERVATVVALVTSDQVPPALPVAEPGEVVQLLDADGLVLATSPNASRTLPVLPAAELAALRPSLGEPAALRSSREATYGSPARVAVAQTSYAGAPVSVVAALPLGEVEGLLAALRLALVVVVPLLTALLALAIWLVLGRALHPVDQLRRAADQVAGTGGGGTLPVPGADDELRALALTLNAMLDRLDVAAARQRAFVADAAHELRSPLAAVRATVEVAQRHPDAGVDLAAELGPPVLRMSYLVDDLLLLARVGSTPVVRQPVDLRSVADDAVRSARRPTPGTDRDDRDGADGRTGTDGQVGTPGPTVVVTGSGQAIGDAGPIARVVRNLVENALRHAVSRVEVTVADGSISVGDDGAGIAPEHRETVFARFVRLDEAREREAGGSGLGLAIAREIAREHGGDVVLGAAPTGGLLARLTLPLG